MIWYEENVFDDYYVRGYYNADSMTNYLIEIRLENYSQSRILYKHDPKQPHHDPTTEEVLYKYRQHLKKTLNKISSKSHDEVKKLLD